MAVTFEQIETQLNNTQLKSRVNKMVVSKPYIVESKISIIPNDIINKLFETAEQVTEILLTYNKKTKEILKIKAKTTKEELLLLRINDAEGRYNILGFMRSGEVSSWIRSINNLYSHNIDITTEEIYHRPERFYIIVLKTYEGKYIPLGIIALYIRGSQRNRKGEISRFVITPLYQNKKYGQNALKKAIKLIQYNELNPFIWVREDNEVMQHIVEKLGFKSTKRIRHNREIDKDFIKWVYDNGEIETVQLDKIEINANPINPPIQPTPPYLNVNTDNETSEHIDLCTCPYCVEHRRTKELRHREERQRDIHHLESESPQLRPQPQRENDESVQDFVNRVLSEISNVESVSVSDLYYRYFDRVIGLRQFIDSRRTYIENRNHWRNNV